MRLWQIGRADGSSSEFALDDGSYSDISKRFPGCTALYTVGHSSASDVPFVIPGPSDSWAGNPQGGLLVRFGVREADPEAALRLKLDFVEVHSGSAPRLEIALNDFRTEVQTPAGADQNYLDTRKTSSKGLCAEVEIPAGTLRAGDNILSVRTVSGSWMVLDAVTFEASAPVKSAPAGAGISLFAAESEPALIYGGTQDELLHPVTLDIANLRPEDIGVEMVVARQIVGGQSVNVTRTIQLERTKADGSRVTYSLDYTADEAGTFDVALRIYPSNPLLPHRMDFALVKWA